MKDEIGRCAQHYKRRKGRRTNRPRSADQRINRRGRRALRRKGAAVRLGERPAHGGGSTFSAANAFFFVFLRRFAPFTMPAAGPFFVFHLSSFITFMNACPTEDGSRRAAWGTPCKGRRSQAPRGTFLRIRNCGTEDVAARGTRISGFFAGRVVTDAPVPGSVLQTVALNRKSRYVRRRLHVSCLLRRGSATGPGRQIWMTVPRLTGVNRDNRPHDWPPLPPCLAEHIDKFGFVEAEESFSARRGGRLHR